MGRLLLLIVVAASSATGHTGATSSQGPDAGTGRSPPDLPGFASSTRCRDCHQEFYKKWATSRHGLAMRPFTPEFAREHLLPHTWEIEVAGRRYRAEIHGAAPVVRERGPDGERTYPIEHALGGKNVFFFLTLRPGGRWQVLPVAFDVRQKLWYDMAGSMVRHFMGQPDEALDWTDRRFTFNAACHNCHVSQFSRNYSVGADAYHTVWTEPGVNCDTCHGPGGEHVRVTTAEGEGIPGDLKIIRTSSFTGSQINSLCASCHAKMTPITAAFEPGEEFLDHYELVTLEDRDFHPDGRELGETFTYTLWRLSPCVASGKLDCLHCHTSSGRNKHVGSAADLACMPCHRDYVVNPAAHSHHRAESEASRCVACHMPETTFARMRRHDHSMLAPTPAATTAFGSPNACNLCHTEHDARWADEWVRKWYARDYQAAILHRAGLIDAARRHDWTRLPAMIAYLTAADRNEMYATALIRLLGDYPGAEKWPALLAAVGDQSPLVRSAAALGLAACPNVKAREVLVAATGDACRLVRIKAAFALSHWPLTALDGHSRARVDRAFAEYEAAMQCAPDDPTAHYNLGVFHQNRGALARAAADYETAIALRPANIPALVNASVVYARLNEPAKAERVLLQALQAEPADAAANFNLGLLRAQQGRPDLAEKRLRTALDTDPNHAEAAYNLGILLADRQLDQTIRLCRTAADLQPDEPRYGYTLALFLRRNGELTEAARVLGGLLARFPDHIDARVLLRIVQTEIARGRTGSSERSGRRATQSHN